MPNQTITPVRQLEILHSGQERLGLQLHSLREKPSSARAQDIRQGIFELFRLTEADNIGRRVGVRPFRWTASCCGFDQALGVLILEVDGAAVAEG